MIVVMMLTVLSDVTEAQIILHLCKIYFEKRFICSLYLCVCVHACMSLCVPYVCRNLWRTLDLLELGLQMVVSHYVGAGG